jgi:hypothetical protein
MDRFSFPPGTGDGPGLAGKNCRPLDGIVNAALSSFFATGGDSTGDRLP